MRKKLLILSVVVYSLMFAGCNTAKADNSSKSNAKDATGIVHLNNDSFKKMVFNYETGKEWKYEGSKPAIIDFYADWCAPCRQLAPVVEELAKEYSGKINIYKVDTDVEKELARALGISALPTLLFIPTNGQPQITQGALPREMIVKAINDILLPK
jgi:thioredoxin